MDKSEVQLWLRHPVTQWIMTELSEDLRPTAAQWAAAQTWAEVLRLQGREEVFQKIEALVGNPNA